MQGAQILSLVRKLRPHAMGHSQKYFFKCEILKKSGLSDFRNNIRLRNERLSGSVVVFFKNILPTIEIYTFPKVINASIPTAAFPLLSWLRFSRT